MTTHTDRATRTARDVFETHLRLRKAGRILCQTIHYTVRGDASRHIPPETDRRRRASQ
jgi:hypothetical protein